MPTDVASVAGLVTQPFPVDSVPHHLQHQLQPTIVTPVNADLLEFNLQDHPDQQLVQQVIQGFRHGFSLKYKGPRDGHIPPNLASARQYSKQLQQHLNKEIAKGCILGPFCNKPFSNLICSLVGMVPKKEQGKMRMITHLSYPLGHSINSFISPEDAAMQYQSCDSALVIVTNYGHGAFMSKGDVESAFQILPINPSDWPLLGIHFNH